MNSLGEVEYSFNNNRKLSASWSKKTVKTVLLVFPCCVVVEYSTLFYIFHKGFLAYNLLVKKSMYNNLTIFAILERK